LKSLLTCWRLEIKGKYYPDRTMANAREPPMFLHISSNSKSALDKAAKLIDEIIQRGAAIIDRGGLTEGGMARLPTRGEAKGLLEEFDVTAGYNPANRLLTNSIEAKVFMPSEINANDYGSFKVRAKVVGPQGSFVKHIQSETNTRVVIRGRGSGYLEVATGQEADEALHVSISGATQENVDKAKQFLADLMETVVTEYREWKSQNAPEAAAATDAQAVAQLTGDPQQDYAMYFAWYKAYYESVGYPDADTIAAQFAAQSLQQAMAQAGMIQAGAQVPPPPAEDVPPPPEDVPPPPEDDVPPPPEDDVPPPPEDDVPPPPEDDVPPPPEDDVPPPPEDDVPPSPEDDVPPPEEAVPPPAEPAEPSEAPQEATPQEDEEMAEAEPVKPRPRRGRAKKTPEHHAEPPPTSYTRSTRSRK